MSAKIPAEDEKFRPANRLGAEGLAGDGKFPRTTDVAPGDDNIRLEIM
jgi:hypothetical protein